MTDSTLTSTIPTGDKEKLNTSYCDLNFNFTSSAQIHFLKRWNTGAEATIPFPTFYTLPLSFFSIFKILTWELPDIKKCVRICISIYVYGLSRSVVSDSLRPHRL